MSALRSLLALLLVAVAAPCVADGSRAAEIADEVRGLRLDPDGAVSVSGLRLRAGLASVTLSDGVLVPSTPVAGRPVEFAFVGAGRIELEPPDEVEAGQLELFTGSSVLSESFEEAVFVVALDAAADAFSRAPRVPGGDRSGAAERLFDAWHASAERRQSDVDARIFADAVGDRLAAGFFCGSFEGTSLGRFLYVVDPLEYEEMTLGQFVPVDLTVREEKKTRRAIEREQHRGKLIGFEVEDLGVWDTWVSSGLGESGGRPAVGARGVEPNHYDIDATLDGRHLDLTARAVLTVVVLVDGLRTVSFEMNPDLRPGRVSDGAGRDLEWFRSRNELVAVLPEPATAGDTVDIAVHYAANPFEKIANGAWIQRDTIGWYPHAGSIDRATYTLTVRWPKRLDVVAPGAPDEGGEDVEGRRWRRWTIDRPTVGISFEIGDFDYASGRVGDVAVSVAVDRLGRRAERQLEGEILETVIDALDFYTQVFGPYPLQHLQVVSSPRGFSQGLLGFVSLSTGAVLDWDIWGAVLGIQDRRTVIAHELAHQWWGNLVGWESYRDQWISEAMASYSALLWSRRRVEPSGDDRMGWGPTSGWQAELGRTTEDGRPIESIGPLILGVRLDSSISSRAYTAIVYKKGAVVLDMLASYFSEETFLEILHELVVLASGKVISTDNFLRAIAHLGNTDLDWFSRQYVYGTGLPEISYTYDSEDLGDGRWAVSGTATQTSPYRYRYAVVTTDHGALDVLRRAEPQLDVADSVLVVPFQIGVASELAGGGGQRRMLRGRVVVAGESSPFRVEVNRAPEVFWLDRDGEVFGRFFAADRWPKRTLFYRGQDLAAVGDPDGARDTLRRALRAEVAVIPAGWEEFFRRVDEPTERDSLDARIRLALARLALDAGELVAARSELELAADRVKSRDRWLLAADLVAVESRVELLANDARSAFKRLKRSVLGRRGVDSPEAWALLAVAARAVGDDEISRQAIDRARELGVDLGPLDDVDSWSVTP